MDGAGTTGAGKVGLGMDSLGRAESDRQGRESGAQVRFVGQGEDWLGEVGNGTAELDRRGQGLDSLGLEGYTRDPECDGVTRRGLGRRGTERQNWSLVEQVRCGKVGEA